MARAIWSGSLGFGLVNVPIRLFSATKSRDVRFNQLQEGTGRRIRYRRVAEGTDEEVPYEETVKGYEVDDGRYVPVSREELEAVEPERTHAITIEDFVDQSEIDPIHYNSTYYLAPQEGAGAEKPYALLLRALTEEGKVGIARFVLRTKEHLAAVRPKDGILTVETMYFADEVRSADDVEGLPVEAEVSDKELRMARQLVSSMATDWDPERYEDTYRERVLSLIEDKAEGREVVAPEAPEGAEVVDLMEALRRSVEATGKPAATGDGAAGNGKASLERLSKEDLYERAQEQDIPGRSTMSKEELVEAIREAS